MRHILDRVEHNPKTNDDEIKSSEEPEAINSIRGQGTVDRRQEAREVPVLCGDVDAWPGEQFKSNSKVEKHSADGVGVGRYRTNEN